MLKKSKLCTRESLRIGQTDKLWLMYSAKFPKEYRVGRDVFRSTMHERGLQLRRRSRATRTTDSRHNLPTHLQRGAQQH